MSLLDRLLEIRVQQQILQIWLSIECFLDSIQELSSDDTTTSPKQSAIPVVEIPLVLFARFLQLHKALSVRTNLGSVQSLLNGFHEELLVTHQVVHCGGERCILRCRWARKDFAGSNSCVFDRRKRSCVNSGGDQRRWNTQVQRQLAHPLARALGTSHVKNFVDQVPITTLVIFGAEDVSGDFDQVALQFALVPFRKDIVKFFIGKAGSFLEQEVSLAD